MDSFEDLLKLEKAVDELLKAVHVLQSEKHELVNELADKEQENKKLAGQLKSLKEEREQIDERVSGLLDAIEKWEKQTDSSTAAEEDGAEKIENTLF